MKKRHLVLNSEQNEENANADSNIRKRSMFEAIA